MIAVTEQGTTQSSAAEMLALARQAAGDGPAWLRAARHAAIDVFAEQGYPTTKHEDWRFTNVAPIADTRWQWPKDGQRKVGDLTRFAVPGLDCTTLVFLDGRYRADLSEFTRLPDGVRIQPLAEVLDDKAVKAQLTKHAPIADQPFAALNTAFLGEGVFVEVPAGVDLEAPIHILNIATSAAGDEPVMTHPRNLIVAGDNAEVRIIEHYVALDYDATYFTNAITEVHVAPRARVSHYLIEEESLKAYNISGLHARIETEGRLDSHTVLLDGAIVRNVVHPVLAGERSHCLVNGLFIGEGRQILDNFMRIEHRAPNCESHQYYNGILNHQSRGVFTGRIVVDQIAQKTDAKQTSANLLLSDDAQIDTMPQLEIYADDVKCTHGATIGQLDEDALFYLQARGISRDAARAMMVYAFAAETFERMRLVEPIQAMLVKKLLARLPEGDFLKSVL